MKSVCLAIICLFASALTAFGQGSKLKPADIQAALGAGKITIQRIAPKDPVPSTGDLFNRGTPKDAPNTFAGLLTPLVVSPQTQAGPCTFKPRYSATVENGSTVMEIHFCPGCEVFQVYQTKPSEATSDFYSYSPKAEDIRNTFKDLPRP